MACSATRSRASQQLTTSCDLDQPASFVDYGSEFVPRTALIPCCPWLAPCLPIILPPTNRHFHVTATNPVVCTELDADDEFPDHIIMPESDDTPDHIIMPESEDTPDHIDITDSDGIPNHSDTSRFRLEPFRPNSFSTLR